MMDIYTENQLLEIINNGVINDDIVIHGEGVQKLNGIKTIVGTLGISDSNLKSLGDLVEIKGDFWLNSYSVYSYLTTLGKLKKVNGDITLRYSNIEGLGDLEYVGGKLSLRDTPIKNLGKLKYVGGDLFLPERFRDKVNIEVKGKIRYWNDVHFARVLKPTEELSLAQYEDNVPFWSMMYVTSHQAIRLGDNNQRRFYKEFKKRFLEGEFLDIKGNSNYAFILLFEIASIFKEDRDLEKLQSSMINLGNNYPKTSIYIPRVLIDANNVDLIKWTVKNYDVFINEEDARNICKVFNKNEIEELKSASPSFNKSCILNEIGRLEKRKNYLKAWEIRTNNDLCDFHSLKLYDKKIEKSLTTGAIILNIVYESTLTSFGINNREEILKIADLEIEKHEKILGKKITSINSRNKLELKFREILRESEDIYRASIGMPKIGEGWISETELFYCVFHSN
jgi:hypothetical protein